MKNENDKLEEQTQSVIAISLRLGFIALLLISSFKIIAPFLMPIIWGVIISIGVYPLFHKLSNLLNGRTKIAAAILVIIGIGLFVVPFAVVIVNTVEGIEHFLHHVNQDTFQLPTPPKQVADWPIIGEQVYDLWERSHNNLMVLITKLKPYLTMYLPKIFSSAAGVFGIIFQFILSMIISGLFLVNAESGRKTAILLFQTIIGKGGEAFVDISKGTISGVVQGVLGTAVIQTIFLGLGLYVVGVPAAGVWTVLILLVAIIQLPPSIIVIPIIIYVFSTNTTTIAIIFAIWSFLWSASDNVLKPILMGRGVDIPMLVILIGSIGGMLAFGIIGLFVGSVVLAITYKIIITLGQRPKPVE